VTAGLIAWLGPSSVFDPACGDGSIVLLANDLNRIDRILLRDISQPGCDAIPRKENVEVQVGDIMSSEWDEEFDLVVLTEVLEHIEDPDRILRLARRRSKFLVASSPEMRIGQFDRNVEHLWMFDGDGYVKMLMDAGWLPFHKTHMGFPNSDYDFQIWVCAIDVPTAKNVFMMGREE
jgi:hypothetical protein